MSETREDQEPERHPPASVQDEKADATKWANHHLSRAGLTDHLITDLAYDLADGTTLLQLVQCLSGEALPRHFSNPLLRVQKRENIQICLKYLRQHGIVDTTIHSEDVAGGNVRKILTLCHSLKFYYESVLPQMQGLSSGVHRSNTLPSSSMRPKQGPPIEQDDREILAWVGGLVHRNIVDYASLYDGLILCELIYTIKEGSLPIHEVNQLSQFDRLLMAFTAGERCLGITKGSIDLGKLVHGRENHKLKTYLQHLQVIYTQQQERPVMGVPLRAVVSVPENRSKRMTSYNYSPFSVVSARQTQHDPRESPGYAQNKEERIRSHSFGRSTEDISSLRSVTRSSSHTGSKRGRSKYRDRYLSEIDLTAATSLVGYQSPGRVRKEQQRQLEMQATKANQHSPTTAIKHAKAQGTSYSQQRTEADLPSPSPLTHSLSMNTPPATPTELKQVNFATNVGPSTGSGDPVHSEHIKTCIEDISERVKELSIAFSQERDDIITKLMELVAKEKRRRMKVEKQHKKALRRMEEAAKRYDECFVLLAKDVAHIKEELVTVKQQSVATESVEQQLRAISLKVEDLDSQHQVSKQHLQEVQRSRGTPSVQERSKKSFFGKKKA